MGCPKIVPKGNLSEMVSNWQISIGYEDNQIMTAITERKSPSGATSAVDDTSNHDVPAVGKPTEQTPDMFSIVDATERVVELEVVNNVLLPRQRNTDKEPTTDGPGETKESPRQMTDTKKGHHSSQSMHI